MLKIIQACVRNFARVSWVAGYLMFAAAQLYAQSAAPNELPPGEGKDLLTAICAQCHGLSPILMVRDGPAGWKSVVGDMALIGAQLLPNEADTLIQYLAKNFGPGSKPIVAGNPADTTASAETGDADKTAAASLPAGAGKELVESRCALCHDLAVVTKVGRTKQEWDHTVRNMIARGATATPGQIQMIISYLNAHFGEDAK